MPFPLRTGVVSLAIGFVLSSADATRADMNVSNLPGHEAEVTVDINPTDPQNLVIAAHAPINGNDIPTLNTFYSKNGGQSWTLVSIGNAQDGMTSTRRFDPSVAFDADGNVYVAYLIKLSGSQTGLIVAKSVNGGQTYNQFELVDANGDIGLSVGNDKCVLATGPDRFNPAQENVYVTWMRLEPDQPYADQTVVVSRSTNGGATFSAPKIINDASLGGISPCNAFPDPAVGPNGEVYVVWHNCLEDRVFVDVSFDAGANWGEDRLVTTSDTGLKTTIPAAPDRGVYVGPVLDVDRSPNSFNGRLYVAYTDVAGGGLPDIDIYVRHSDNHGQTWSNRVRVNDDFGDTNSQFLPWLDVDQISGVVTVVWYDTRSDANNKKAEVFLSASLNGGAFFFDNVKVSDGASDESEDNDEGTVHDYLEYIGVAAHGCRAHVVWSDNSQDPADMDYYADLVFLPVTPLGIACSADATVECSQIGGTPANDPAIVAFLLAVHAVGGCGPVSVTHNAPAFFPLGKTTVTFTATDAAGSTAQCSADVTVVDTTPPIISCPRDVVVDATEACGTPANDPQLDPFFAQASAIDLCDPNVDITHDAPNCFPVGKTTVTFCATDDGGNQSCCEAEVAVIGKGKDKKISDTSGGFTGTLSDGDHFGSGVAVVGALDGDDVVDMAVGARGDDDGGVDRGAVWILFLKVDGTVKAHQKISAVDGGFAGPLSDGDGFGRSVAPLGDLDDDGVGDLAVGADGDDDGGPDRGAVWILFLNRNGTVKRHQRISSSNGGFTGALSDGDRFGRSVTPLGDLDGDSVVDLAVGAHLDDDGGSDRGAVWILFLNRNGTVKAHQKISAVDGGFGGALGDGDEFGTGVCALGDFDDDGHSELGVGAPRDDDGGPDRGALWVLFLDGSGMVKTHGKISDTVGGFGGALDDGDLFGSVRGRLGDFDCDGRDEVAVGAVGDDDGGTDRGAVWLLYLNGDGSTKRYQKISATEGGFTGSLSDGDHFGTDIAPLADLNGDNLLDMAVSAEGDDDGGPERGAVWVLFDEGTGCPVPVLVQSFHASWVDDHIEVVWRLLEDGAGRIGFDILRREEPSGIFEVLAGPNVFGRDGELVFEDRDVEVGRTYRYRVIVREDVEPVTSFEVTVIAPAARFALYQNRPNPFNPSTRIVFSLDRAGAVMVAVYDVSGHRVRTLVDRAVPAGVHEVEWDGLDGRGRSVASGLYLIRLTAGGRSLTRKAVVLK